MATIIKARYRLRSGTTAEWATHDEVLGAGEVGEEVTTDGRRLRKVGDGTSKWSELLYRLNFPVDESAAPADKQVLAYDEATGLLKWADQSGGGGTTIVVAASGDLTLSAADHKDRMLLHSGGAITCPETVAAGFAVSDLVEVRRQSSTAVTFVAGSGNVTLDYDTARYSAAINGAKDVVALKVIAANTWALLGPLADK